MGGWCVWLFWGVGCLFSRLVVFNWSVLRGIQGMFFFFFVEGLSCL